MAQSSSEIPKVEYTKRRKGLQLLGAAGLALVLAACGSENTDVPATATSAAVVPTLAPTLAPTPTSEKIEAKPTIGPRGELLIGAEFEASGGQSTPFVYQERTLLPGDIPQEYIDKYGFVANGKKEVAQKAIAPDGTTYIIFGHPSTINGKAYDRSSSRPDLGVFAYEGGIYLPGLIEANPDSQYFLASEKSSGKIVVLVRNPNGLYSVLDDRDPTLPETQEWLLKTPKGANISIQAGSGGFITIGETSYSTSLPKLTPLDQVVSSADCPLYTRDQILASPTDNKRSSLNLKIKYWGISPDSILIKNSDDKGFQVLACARMNSGPIIGDKIVAKIAIPGTNPNNPTIFYGASLNPINTVDQDLSEIKSPKLQIRVRTFDDGLSAWGLAASQIISESELSEIHAATHSNFDLNSINAGTNLFRILSGLEGKLAPVWFDSY